MSAPLRHPVIPAADGRQETAPAVVYLDLTVIDRIPPAAATTITLDNFVAAVAAETERSEAEYLAADYTSHRRAWEGKW